MHSSSCSFDEDKGVLETSFVENPPLDEKELLWRLSPGETLEENMWRDKLARLVEAYSRLSQWELDVVGSQSMSDAYGHCKWWHKRRHG